MLTQEMIDELNNAADIDGTETGEYWLSLINLYEQYTYAMSEEFVAALAAEILSEYNYFKTNFQIVEEEITTVTVVKRLNEL